ncbi:MAG: carotenoid oxygenase family protein [Acidimicrobiia bacterium]
MTVATVHNRYLEENFGPVSEETTAFDLPVTGTIPAQLDGRYLRNGPNPIGDADPAIYHWFLGAGMVHGVRLRDGKAEWYRNRWVRSGDVAGALGEPRRPGKVHAGFDFPANTNVIAHAGRTLALVEGGARPYELTDELETVQVCDFDGTLKGGYTAHPKLDPETGELHAISYYWGWANRVRYSVTGTDGRVRHSVFVKVSGSPMMHDFSLTRDHVVIYDLPVTFDPVAASTVMPRWLRRPSAFFAKLTVGHMRVPGALAGVMAKLGDNKLLPYGWDPAYPPRVGVLPRNGGPKDVRWFDVEPCYVFHPLNAYDDGDKIVLDVVRHPKMFATHRLGPNEGVPTLDRWTIDLSAGKVLESRLDDRGQEFPRVDERRLGLRHRYGYSVGIEAGPARNGGGDADGKQLEPSGTVMRHDLVAGTTDVRHLGAGRTPGEFVFVPSGPGAAEDDGVLMGYVHDAATDRSDLELLDAATLETVAQVHLPTRVPHGFHGNWAPS